MASPTINEPRGGLASSPIEITGSPSPLSEVSFSSRSECPDVERAGHEVRERAVDQGMREYRRLLGRISQHLPVIDTRVLEDTSPNDDGPDAMVEAVGLVNSGVVHAAYATGSVHVLELQFSSEIAPHLSPEHISRLLRAAMVGHGMDIVTEPLLEEELREKLAQGLSEHLKYRLLEDQRAGVSAVKFFGELVCELPDMSSLSGLICASEVVPIALRYGSDPLDGFRIELFVRTTAAEGFQDGPQARELHALGGSVVNDFFARLARRVRKLGGCIERGLFPDPREIKQRRRDGSGSLPMSSSPQSEVREPKKKPVRAAPSKHHSKARPMSESGVQNAPQSRASADTHRHTVQFHVPSERHELSEGPQPLNEIRSVQRTFASCAQRAQISAGSVVSSGNVAQADSTADSSKLSVVQSSGDGSPSQGQERTPLVTGAVVGIDAEAPPQRLGAFRNALRGGDPELEEIHARLVARGVLLPDT